MVKNILLINKMLAINEGVLQIVCEKISLFIIVCVLEVLPDL